MKILESLKIYIKERMANDPSHDFDHIMRVYKNAQKICNKEIVNQKIVLSAVLLHDIISYPKSDKRSRLSSLHSSQEAKKILKKFNFSPKEINQISKAILDHSFSRGKTPTSIEGKILQDADRLDALGAIGVARVFAISGSEKRSFYNQNDPFCKNRKPNDKIWALDHFYQKLLKLESLMNTRSAKIEAKRRTRLLKIFLNQLKKEV